tara:strand:+ start:108 stop:452 length:345 start_codon:yes stop_codon:yes gene_type:complete
MEKIKLNIFIKSKLLKTPENIFSITKNVEDYSEVIRAFLKYKKSKKRFDYEICNIFDFFIKYNNHLILYHSKYKENTLIMIKYLGKYKFYKIPYLCVNEKLEKLKETNFIAYYK